MDAAAPPPPPSGRLTNLLVALAFVFAAVHAYRSLRSGGSMRSGCGCPGCRRSVYRATTYDWLESDLRDEETVAESFRRLDRRFPGLRMFV